MSHWLHKRNVHQTWAASRTTLNCVHFWNNSIRHGPMSVSFGRQYWCVIWQATSDKCNSQLFDWLFRLALTVEVTTAYLAEQRTWTISVDVALSTSWHLTTTVYHNVLALSTSWHLTTMFLLLLTVTHISQIVQCHYPSALDKFKRAYAPCVLKTRSSAVVNRQQDALCHWILL